MQLDYKDLINKQTILNSYTSMIVLSSEDKSTLNKAIESIKEKYKGNTSFNDNLLNLFY